MEKFINRVELTGYVDSDPILYKEKNGCKVCSLFIKTISSYKGKDFKIEEVAECHEVVFLEDFAETTMDSVQKGSKIYIEGQLRTTKWIDNDGITRYSSQVLCEEAGIVFGNNKILDNDIPF